MIQQPWSWNKAILRYFLAAWRDGGTPASGGRGGDAPGGLRACWTLVASGQEGVYAEGAFVFLDLGVHVKGFGLIRRLLVRWGGVGVVFDVVGHLKKKKQGLRDDAYFNRKFGWFWEK